MGSFRTENDIGKATRYYLETSSIRRVGSGLQDIVSISDCFTSAFVLFELVTELTESDHEFNIRKTCITNLLDLDKQSKIQIEWLLPNDRLKAAFPILENKPDHIGKFYRILECAKDSTSSQQFEILLADRQLTDYFKWLECEHSNITVDVQKIINEAPSLSQIGNNSLEKHRPNLEKTEKRALIRRAKEMLSLYQSAIGYSDSISNFASKFVPDDASEDNIQRIVNSYNGSVDLFIKAFAHIQNKYNTGGYSAEENDFADLLHLLYLCDGDVFVSEEGDNKLITCTACELGISVQHIASLQGN